MKMGGTKCYQGFPNDDNEDNKLMMDRPALASQGYGDCIHAGL